MPIPSRPSRRATATGDETSRQRVAALLRESLLSAEVKDLIEPEDPAPPHPEFDLDQRFYSPLCFVRAVMPFAPERPGIPTFRDILLDCVRNIRDVMRRRGIEARDCKAYLPTEDEAGAALLYFRIDGTVFAAVALAGPGEEGDQPDSIWDLTVATNVDDEAIDRIV
jgi:hypothetical protein